MPNQTESSGPATTYNILFVCTGNTCRSPMAAAAAQAALRTRGWTHVDVASAGIAAAGGQPAAEHAVRVAAERGMSLDSHSSRLLSLDRIAWADLILVMSPSHLAAVIELGGGEKVELLTRFADGGDGEPVEDPFGAGEETYREAMQQIETAIDGVLRRLEPILSP